MRNITNEERSFTFSVPSIKRKRRASLSAMQSGSIIALAVVHMATYSDSSLTKKSANSVKPYISWCIGLANLRTKKDMTTRSSRNRELLFILVNQLPNVASGNYHHE